MKKKIYFTSRADAQKEANELNTFVSLVYDTEEGKLQLIDSFGGEVKTFDVTLTEVAAEEGNETPEPENP